MWSDRTYSGCGHRFPEFALGVCCARQLPRRSFANTYGNCYGYSYSYGNLYAYSNGNGNSYSYADGYCQCYAALYANAKAASYAVSTISPST